MTDGKTLLRSILTGSTVVTNLVPASRIYFNFPTSFNTFPIISYSENNNFTEADGYEDNSPKSDSLLFQVDIWQSPNTSTTAIAQAVSNAMESKLFNRDSSIDMVEPDTGVIHKVLRFSGRVYNGQ